MNMVIAISLILPQVLLTSFAQGPEDNFKNMSTDKITEMWRENHVRSEAMKTYYGLAKKNDENQLSEEERRKLAELASGIACPVETAVGRSYPHIAFKAAEFTDDIICALFPLTIFLWPTSYVVFVAALPFDLVLWGIDSISDALEENHYELMQELEAVERLRIRKLEIKSKNDRVKLKRMQEELEKRNQVEFERIRVEQERRERELTLIQKTQEKLESVRNELIQSQKEVQEQEKITHEYLGWFSNEIVKRQQLPISKYTYFQEIEIQFPLDKNGNVDPDRKSAVDRFLLQLKCPVGSGTLTSYRAYLIATQEDHIDMIKTILEANSFDFQDLTGIQIINGKVLDLIRELKVRPNLFQVD